MATAKITNETMVECKNGTHGNLFYASTRNPGYTVEWTEFGEVQEMDYAELLVMRGSQPRFFRDNWILIEDANVLRKLGVDLAQGYFLGSPAQDPISSLNLRARAALSEAAF